MTTKNRTDLLAEFPDNTTGLIVPSDCRDVINSSILPEDLTAGTNITLTKVGTAVTIAASDASQVNADWTSVSGVSQILNKPTIPTELWESNDGILSPTPNASVSITGASDTTALVVTPTNGLNPATNIVEIHSQINDSIPFAVDQFGNTNTRTININDGFLVLTGNCGINVSDNTLSWNLSDGLVCNKRIECKCCCFILSKQPAARRCGRHLF